MEYIEQEICILCKQSLLHFDIVYEGKIRADNDNKCKIVKCIHCSHIQLVGSRCNLKQHYDDDSQSQDIINKFNLTIKDIIYKEHVEITRRIKYLQISNNKHYNVLDIGSGYCSFAKKLVNSNINVKITCLEPSVKRTDTGKIYNNINEDENNIMIKNIYLDDNFADINNESFDIVTSWHVLEHLDYIFIDKVIQNMYKCCKKGGKIVIEVPNSEDELFKLDKYKQINYMIHHLSYWNEQTLSLILKQNNIHNFEIKHVQRYGFKNYLNWIYNLGEKQDCNMNDDLENMDWVEAKKKSKNTDAILIIIGK